jgi:sugar O-acyltransferase (sialic acid O-acetyltransferase NeuD family)
MKRALIGAGGFANEVKAHIGDFTMKCFVDDEYYTLNNNFIYPLSEFDPEEYEVLIAIGDPRDRFDIVQRLPKNTKYFTFIHPSAQILGNDVYIGKGSIVCAGCILTTNIKIGDHAHLNLQTTIGHDCTIGDYFTTSPGAKISGNCRIYDAVYIGTNASIKQNVSIHSFSTIGLNAGVVKNINESGVYAGVPAKKIK